MYTRSAVPSKGFPVTNVISSPGATTTSPAITPTLSLGPCKSPKIDTFTPISSLSSRIIFIRSVTSA